MSKVLFLSAPAHGNVNPTLGLVHELVERGEEIFYFSSFQFKELIEAAGAHFIPYSSDLDIFKFPHNGPDHPFGKVIENADQTIKEILKVATEENIDYMIHSAAFPLSGIIKKILNVPSVSSFAIFAGLRNFEQRIKSPLPPATPGYEKMRQNYYTLQQRISIQYDIELPQNPMQLIFNTGDINLIYTSKLFTPDAEYFTESFKFVGPPIYQRKEDTDFPFEKLEGKKVIYISLGTVFSNFNKNFYPLFFEAFGKMDDVIVVLAAYNVKLSEYAIPENFIVRHFVPQASVLKHTTVAITHAGMNSISDLVYNEVPFVAIPLGADQPLLAQRANELQAGISIDPGLVNVATLQAAVEEVTGNPIYLRNIQKIKTSFEEAGGYKKAADEILQLKREKNIRN